MKHIETIAFLLFLQLVCSSAKITLQAETTDWYVIKFLTFRTQALHNGEKIAAEQSTWFWYITAGYHERIRKEPSHVFVKININNQIDEERPLIQEKSMAHENIVSFLPLDFSEFCQINLNFAHDISEVTALDDKFIIKMNVSCNLLQKKEIEIRQKMKENAIKKRQESLTKEDLTDLVEEEVENDDDYDQFFVLDDPNAVAINIDGQEEKELDTAQNGQVKKTDKAGKKPVQKKKAAPPKQEVKEGLQKKVQPLKTKSDQHKKGAVDPSKKNSAKSNDAGEDSTSQQGTGRKMKI